MEKKKEKGFSALVGPGGGGGEIRPSRAQGRARARRPSHGPRRETARARERRRRCHGAHASGRAGDGASG
jgi:hypothetical protein